MAWYSAHYPRVYRLCCRIVGQAEAAEDAAQNTFVQAFLKRDQFNGRALRETWLYRIAIRAAIDERRRLDRRQRRESTLAAADTIAAPMTTTNPQLGACIREAVDRLPLSLRLPLIMNVLEGRDHKEVAAVLKITTGASRTRVKRAREQLRTMLAGHTGGSDDE